jgi:hypothetical protein
MMHLEWRVFLLLVIAGCGGPDVAPSQPQPGTVVEAEQAESETDQVEAPPDEQTVQTPADDALDTSAAPLDSLAAEPLPPIPNNRILRQSIGSGELSLEVPFSTIYLSRSTQGGPPVPSSWEVILRPIYADGTGSQKPTDGFLKVDGKAEKLHVSAEPADAVKLLERAFGASFLKPGRVNLQISLKGHTFEIPLNVILLDVYQGIPASEIIESIGLPDRKREISLLWPKTAYVDGVIYGPEPGQVLIRKHWLYAQLPGAVFALEGGRLAGFSNVEPDAPAPVGGARGSRD